MTPADVAVLCPSLPLSSTHRWGLFRSILVARAALSFADVCFVALVAVAPSLFALSSATAAS